MCAGRGRSCPLFLFFFFFNDTATTEIYTLSLHDALPIYWFTRACSYKQCGISACKSYIRSEEHTSELQSRSDLVCRLLLEKKKKTHGLGVTNQSGMQLARPVLGARTP